MTNKDQIPDTCPHCGRQLSPWEQVLLRVDRALMCKGCWYRIFLDTFDPPLPPSFDHKPEQEDKT